MTRNARIVGYGDNSQPVFFFVRLARQAPVASHTAGASNDKNDGRFDVCGLLWACPHASAGTAGNIFCAHSAGRDPKWRF
jgi:hypothetical protein